MTALYEKGPLGEEPPRKSRYDSLVLLEDLYDADAMDYGSVMGLYSICETASKLLSGAEFYCLSATHFYLHDQKKSVKTLAGELKCSEATIRNLIEMSKRTLADHLEERTYKLADHPLLRARIYPLKDGSDSILPNTMIMPKSARFDQRVLKLERMISTLFDADMHFALTSYYLADTSQRLNATQIAQALGLTSSGVYQKLKEGKGILQEACKYQPEKDKLSTHPMFTGEDSYHVRRRLSPLMDEKHLALDTLAIEEMYRRATKMDLKHLVPVMRTHFFDADHKQPLQKIADDMRLSVNAVETYLNEGRKKLIDLLKEENLTLAAHPLLRSHQRYQTEAELSRDYGSLAGPDDNFSQEDRERLLVAGLLFTRQPYHLYSWSMGVPDRGLKAAFKENAFIGKWTNYAALAKSIPAAQALCDQANSIEKEYTAKKFSVTLRQFGLGSEAIRDFN